MTLTIELERKAHRRWLARAPRPAGVMACLLPVLASIPGATTAGPAAAGFSAPLAVPTQATITEIVDLNGDDIPDLVGVRTFGRQASLLFGRGDGTFEPEVRLDLPIPPTHAQAGDLDGDGWLDLVVVGSGEAEILVLYGTGAGTFSAAQIVPVESGLQHAVALADLDEDGLLDVVVTNRRSTVDVLRNAGGRAFEPVRTFPPGNNRPASIAVVDMDGDGKLDLVLGSRGDDLVSVLPGQGDGTFGSPLTTSTGNQPPNAVPVDVDGDGDLDIVATGAFASISLPRGLALLRRSGTGEFQVERIETINNPWGLAVADLNGDGIPDLAVTGWPGFGFAQGVEVLWGSGTGTFVPAGVVGPGVGEVLAADLDGDGRLDLLASSLSNGPSVVLLNRMALSGACIDLDGDGYGAPGDPACARGAAPDCDDQDPNRSPGAPEICDGIDNDCDGRIDEDFDRDGDGVTVCAGDCDDDSADVAPGMPEICDGLDNNCDGRVDEEPEASAACADAFTCTRDTCQEGACVNDPGACIGFADSGALFAHPVALGLPPFDVQDVVLADVTGDGRPDLLEAFGDLILVPGRGREGFGSPRPLRTGLLVGAVAAADLDADGDTDLALTDRLQHRIAILLNQGGGRFVPGETIPLGVRPGAIRAADLDGDGLPDLAVELPLAWKLQVYRNLGEGRFALANSLPGRQRVPGDMVDFTRDDLPDVLLTGRQESSPQAGQRSELFLNEGGFRFAPPRAVPTGAAWAVASGDLDGDRRRDLAVVDADGILALLGDGDGGFEPRRSSLDVPFTRFVTLVDLSGDERPDLVATAGSVGLVRVIGSGDGTFQAVAGIGGGAGHRAAFGLDADADGCLDLAFTGAAGAGVLRGDGRGDVVFHPRVSVDGPVQDVAVGDVDGSGTDDIVVLFPDGAQVLLGAGQGVFRRLPPAPIEPGAQRLFLTAIDHDGFPDLVVLHGAPGEDEVTVRLGRGDGTFSASGARLTTNRRLFTLAVADVNADTIPDVVVANDEEDLNDGSLSTFLGRGDGTFLAAIESDAIVPAGNLVLGEFTGDGVIDAFTLRWRLGPPRNALLLVGQGDGRFQWRQEIFDLGSSFESVQRLVARDLNADGHLDLVLAETTGLFVALGKPTGGVHPQVAHPHEFLKTVIEVVDINGDGPLDVLTLNAGGSVVLFPGQGDGTLAPPVGFLAGRPGLGREPITLASGDLNGNGRRDLVVGEKRSPSLVVLLNGHAGAKPGVIVDPADPNAGTSGSRLPVQARGRECPPGLLRHGGPPGRGAPDILRLPCRVEPSPCDRPRP